MLGSGPQRKCCSLAVAAVLAAAGSDAAAVGSYPQQQPQTLSAPPSDMRKTSLVSSGKFYMENHSQTGNYDWTITLENCHKLSERVQLNSQSKYSKEFL